MDAIITPSPLSGKINAISSKSFAHRALICAALAKGESEITLNAFSSDINATVSCLNSLNANIENRGGMLKINPSFPPKKARLFANESGSTLRFLLPVTAALGVESEFTAAGKLPSRPLSPLKEEMEKHGVSFSDGFPLKISGKLTGGKYVISGKVSSQFVSALIMALPVLNEDSEIEIIPPAESKPYIDMTVDTVRKFGVRITEKENGYLIKGNQKYLPASFSVEGDWSNSSYFLYLGAEIEGLNASSVQGDRKFTEIMSSFGADIKIKNNSVKVLSENLHGIDIDASDIPDLVPLLAVIASTAEGKTRIFNASRLKLKESDRLLTTFELLNNLGADIEKTDDGFLINGVKTLHGGTVDSFNDHRIVMAAASASKKCDGVITIRNAQAVNKSYPSFFDDLISLGGNVKCQ